MEKEEIDGIMMFEPKVFQDTRGYFKESYNEKAFNNFIDDQITFIQDNISESNRHVLRGLHFQIPPYAQGKLIQVLKGSVIDIAVDLRKASNTFGKHVKVELSSQNHRQLWIPPGFAHGFVALEDHTIFSYKCTNHYSKEHEMDLLWNDVDLDIQWGIENPIISDKDKNANSFKNFDSPF